MTMRAKWKRAKSKAKRQAVDRSLHPVVGDPWVYEEEVWTASDWWLRHFNKEFWSIEGMIRTPSSGYTRPEVVGVASEMYAQGIVDAHNAAMREMRERIANPSHHAPPLGGGSVHGVVLRPNVLQP